MQEELLSTTADGVTVLELNRPDKLNALTIALSSRLIDALRLAEGDSAVRAIALLGAGRAFCSGADRSDRTAGAALDIESRGRILKEIRSVFTEISKPVVAGVQGYALGGGAALALSCDMIIVGESLKFGYPELKHGIAPTIALADLVRQVGRRVAFRLLMTGDYLTAGDAVDLHLAYKAVPDNVLRSATIEMARQFASLSPSACTSTKKLLLELEDLSLLQGLDIGQTRFYQRQTK